MKLNKFRAGMFLVLLLLLIFVLVPVLSPMLSEISLPTLGSSSSSDQIADPLEQFDSVSSIKEVEYSGTFRSDNVYRTTYIRAAESCNTYTLSGEVKLYQENNGLSDTSNNVTIDTYEPTAITCMTNPTMTEREKSIEVVVLLLGYNSETGEYVEYTPSEIKNLREDQKAQDDGFFELSDF